MKYEAIKEKITKNILETLYCQEFKSLAIISKELCICPSTLNKLLKEYNLTRDKAMVRSASNTSVKNKHFEDIKNRISRDTLYQYYIVENHPYYNTLDHFKISDWTFNRLLDEYDIKKDRSISGKQGLQTKYEKAGGKDIYDKQQKEVAEKTKIEKYGSLENYSKHISSKCSVSWNSKSDEEKAQLSKISMSHGAGWNKETIKNTLLQKYGVDNAYKLAKNYQTNSKVNQHFADMLSAHDISYEREQLIENMRYDFKIGDTFVELDPWPFHNTTWCPIADAKLIDKNYHKNKSQVASTNGYSCIHIFDWDDPDKIINILSKRDVIYARKCVIKEISRDEAKEYLNKYHLQGYARDVIRLGLFHDDELVSIMTFGKPRYNKNYEYELIRLCSNKKVIGGEEKLFKYFLDKYNPRNIISYCDMSKFSGKIYDLLQFEKIRVSKPSKHWYNPKTKQHITDNLLRQRGFDQLFKTNYGKGTSNEELMISNGFVEIYDCGQAVFVYDK